MPVLKCIIRYSNNEKYQMLECFILSGRNDIKAVYMYFIKYPERQQPDRCMFRRLNHNLRNYGSSLKPRKKRGRGSFRNFSNCRLIF